MSFCVCVTRSLLETTVRAIPMDHFSPTNTSFFAQNMARNGRGEVVLSKVEISPANPTFSQLDSHMTASRSAVLSPIMQITIDV